MGTTPPVPGTELSFEKSLVRGCLCCGSLVWPSKCLPPRLGLLSIPGPTWCLGHSKVVELQWVGSEGRLLCILGLPAQAFPHCVLRQAYVTTWPGQAGHDSQPHFVPPLSLPLPSPTELLLAGFLKPQV